MTISKKLLGPIMASLTLLGLTACGGQELANVTLLETVALDGPGPVELAAVGEGDSRVYRAAGADVSAARDALSGLGSARLETTHIAHLVLGPDVDVAGCLWQMLTHRESGYGATVWLWAGPGPAGDALEGDVSARLTSLEENAGVAAPTVLAALSDLARQGWADLPLLSAGEEELTVTGYERVEVRA